MNAAGERDLVRLIGAGDLLLIVPPFAAADRASLAAHLLQACARRAGFKVRILYANMVLAAEIGWSHYNAICDRKVGPPNLLVGERLFSGCAHGQPFFDEGVWGSDGEPLLDQLKAVEEIAWTWAEAVSGLIAGLDFPIYASTTTFEQTNASFALLHRVKQRRPGVLTLIGGANCDAVMAGGIASLDPDRRCFDYIFSGESEQALPKFLQSYAAGDLPDGRIVQGTPCLDLDSLPVVDYTEYFEQRDCLIPTSEADEPAILPLESSRGCWWGQKHHCTFCGLNATGMAFREKSPGQVVLELRTLASSYSSRRVAMTDNIMPHSYFGSVVPQLAEEGLGLKIFYEQKANLSLSQVRALKKAGIVSIQPGIESLSDGLLDLMDKGVSAKQNLRLLRYARSAGVHLFWNLLWGFPGDRSEWYQQMAEFLPVAVSPAAADRPVPLEHRPLQSLLRTTRRFWNSRHRTAARLPRCLPGECRCRPSRLPLHRGLCQWVARDAGADRGTESRGQGMA